MSVFSSKINIISYEYYIIAKTSTESSVLSKFVSLSKNKILLKRYDLTITGVEKSGISGALN